MRQFSRFYNELKRRNVFRAGAAYVVLSWLVVQVADILFDAFDAPAWLLRALIVSLVIGLPIALLLSWIYEITVEGVKRTVDVCPNESITDRTGRKLDFIVIGFLSVAVALFAIDRFLWRQFEDESHAATYKFSVAVLPFQLASENTPRFFGQLSQDISRLLQRNDQFQLASPDAIDALPDNSNSAEIAARLGVRYLVTGIFRSDTTGESLSVALFDYDASSSVWTDDFENVQLPQTLDAVAESLSAKIGGNSLSLLSSMVDPIAYERYLSARQHWAVDELSDEAEDLFRDAVAIDPRFGAALAGLCAFLVHRYYMLGSADDFEEAERLCHRAWTVDALSVEVNRALGDLYTASGQIKKARDSYSSAMAINPNDLKTQVSIVQTFREEDPDLAERELKKIIRQHPGSPEAHGALQYLYFFQGRYAEAVEQQRWIVRLRPNDEKAKKNLSSGLILAGKFAEAKALLSEMLKDDSLRAGDIESNLASVMYFEEDYAGAAELYRAAINRTPEMAYLYSNLGDAIWHLDGKDTARSIFGEAISLAGRQLEINPDDRWALVVMMRAHASIGNLDRFIFYKDIVLEVSGDDPQTHYDVAVSASRLGDIEAAKRHTQRALDLGYPIALLRADPDISASLTSFE